MTSFSAPLTSAPVAHLPRETDPATVRLRRLVLALTALALALAILTTLGIGAWLLLRRLRPVGPSYALRVRFADANGLRAGDAVSLAGVNVGRVEAVQIIGNRAEARLQIQNDVPISQGARFVATPTLFGEAGGVHVLAADGAEGESRPTLTADTPALDGEAAPDLAETFARASTVTERMVTVSKRSERLLDEATATVQEMREAARDPALRSDLRATLASVQTVTRNTAALSGKTARLVEGMEPGARRTMTEAAGLTREMRGVAAEMRGIVRQSRPQVAGLLADTRRTVSATSQAVARGSNLIPAGPQAARQVTDMVDDLSASTANLRAVSEKVDAAAASGRDLLADPKVADDIKQTLASLRATAESAEKAVANSKPLTEDPTVAADVRAILRSTRQVSETSARLLELLTAAAQKKAK